MRKFIKGGFLAIFLFLSPLKVFALDFVVFNENILSSKVQNKLNLIGQELYDKTGIFLAVAVGDKTSFETLVKMQENLPKPYVLLALSKDPHKVDILGNEALAFFDKEAVLSRYPNTGSILPILGSNKGDIYNAPILNAAILNGYADIAERIAKYFNIRLEHSIGNANRDTINILRILVYGFICFALLYYIQRKMKRKRSV